MVRPQCKHLANPCTGRAQACAPAPAGQSYRRSVGLTEARRPAHAARASSRAPGVRHVHCFRDAVFVDRSLRLRWSLLVPLLALAAWCSTRLVVDAENLAMKSVGTASASADRLRAQEFGSEPALVVLAEPREAAVAPADVDLSAWEQGLRARPEVAGVLGALSPSAGVRAVALRLRTREDGRYAAAAESLAAHAADDLPAGHCVALGGVPVVEVAIAHAMASDRARVLPLVALALTVVLAWAYRSLRLALAALALPLAGVLVLEGLQGAIGLAVDPVSSLLGPVVLTVGVASSVHVMERYAALRAEGRDARASRSALLRELWTPVVLALATTVAGLLGLLGSPIPAVGRFAWLASLGVALTMSATLLYLPDLLAGCAWPARDARVERRRRARRGTLWIARHALPIVVLGAGVGGWSVAATLSGRVDSDPLHVLEARDGVRLDAARIAAHLGGSEVFELLLPPRAGATPLALLELLRDVSALDGVAQPAGAPRTSPAGFALLAFVLEPGGSEAREHVFAQTEALARGHGFAGAQATGLPVRLSRDSGELVRGQRRGILATLVALAVLLGLGFRSIGLGLLGLVPNAMPVFLVQGGMAALDRPLTVASSMIATVMLGLVIDDTVHLLHAWRETRGGAVQRSVRALTRVGRPVVLTSVVLAAGFAATGFGRLHATREFGALAVFVLVTALLANLLLLPALLLLGSRFTGPARARS
jgi:predicted RND superfamily exporter protein